MSNINSGAPSSLKNPGYHLKATPSFSEDMPWAVAMAN
jgi:hypothetical protein